MKTVREALPYAFDFDPDRTALVVIDMQNDFCSAGGFGEKLGNDITPTRAIIPVIQKLLQVARDAGIMIVHTREGHLPDLSDCPPAKLERSKRMGAGIGDDGPMGRILIRGEQGHAIVEELAPLEDEAIIDKPGKGAFYKTELEHLLERNGIESLVLCDRGYRCLVLEDATAAFDQSDHQAAIHMVRQQGGIFGWTSGAESLIAVIEL